MESEFRQPNKTERDLLQRLLETEFPGRDELASLFQDIRVKTVDEVGSLELQSRRSGTAKVIKRIPVEAEARDTDGFNIHVLLHVVNGRPVELEIFKDDGSCVKQMPPPSAFELVVLPPMPRQA